MYIVLSGFLLLTVWYPLQERENLKVQLLEKERLHQGHTNDLMQAVDQMRAELDETRSRLFALSQAGGEVL